MKLAWVRWEDHWKSLVGLPPVMVIKSGSLDHLDTVCIYIYISGWWFGTMDFFDFPKRVGNVTIPTDELIFSEGLKPPASIYIYMKMIYVGFTQCHKQLSFGDGFRKKQTIVMVILGWFRFLFSTLYS